MWVIAKEVNSKISSLQKLKSKLFILILLFKELFDIYNFKILYLNKYINQRRNYEKNS